MSLSWSWPSRANFALPPISGNSTFLPWPDLCNDLNYFCSQPYYLCTSACRSHCLRYWPLNYTGFFIRFCIKALPLDVDIKVPYVFHVSVSEYILSRSDRIKPFTAFPPSFVWKFSTSLSWKLQDKPRGTGNQQTACSRSFFKHELVGLFVSASLSDEGGLAVGVIDLTAPRLFFGSSLSLTFVGNWRNVVMGLWTTWILKGCRMREMSSDMLFMYGIVAVSVGVAVSFISVVLVSWELFRRLKSSLKLFLKRHGQGICFRWRSCLSCRILVGLVSLESW